MHHSNSDPLQRPLAALVTDGETEKVISAILSESKQTTVLVAGPKSSGKSTLARIITNSLLSARKHKTCFYLDLDPGQPEFTAPGVVSLVQVTQSILGPTYTHPLTSASGDNRILRQHAIAATSFKDDPEHFMACAVELYNHMCKLRRSNPGASVVINSCGWVTGTGSSVLADFVDLADLSDIVAIDPLEDTLVERLSTTNQRTTLHRLSKRPAAPATRTPAELRAMQTLAYFHRTNDAKWNHKAMSEMTAWKVSYVPGAYGISASLSYGQSFNPEFLAEVLDGAIVAITVVEDEILLPGPVHLNGQSDEQEDPENLTLGGQLKFTTEGLPYIEAETQGISNPIDPTGSHCAALALVRAIDVEAKQLHLVTPLSESEIEQFSQRKVVLVRGGFDLPDWAFLEDLYRAGDGAQDVFEEKQMPWVARKELVGIEGKVWRTRHPPLQGRQ